MDTVDKMKSQCQGQTSIQVGGTTQVIYTYKSGSTVYTNYSVLQSKITGAAQIILGILLILSNIILLGAGYFDTSIAVHGFWGGAIFIVSGSFGLASSRHKSKCLAFTYMVLSIVSALICIPLIGFSAWGISIAAYCRSGTYRYLRGIPYGCEFGEAFHALMLTFTLLEGICAIWGSTLCCKAAPCCSNTNQAAIPMQFFAANGNHMIVIGSTPAVEPIKTGEEGDVERQHSVENQRGVDCQRLLE